MYGKEMEYTTQLSVFPDNHIFNFSLESIGFFRQTRIYFTSTESVVKCVSIIIKKRPGVEYQDVSPPFFLWKCSPVKYKN